MKPKAIIFTTLRRTSNERFEILSSARRVGLNIILISEVIPDWVAPYVSESFKVDTLDYQKVLRYVADAQSRYDIVGAISWTDLDLELVGHINSELRLTGITPEIARIFRNKWLMRSALQQCPEFLPRFAKVVDEADLKQAFNEVGFPAVLKPTGANGSKGIFVVKDAFEAGKAFEHLKRMFDRRDDAIIRRAAKEFILEEFLVGDEVSVEVIVSGGKPWIVGVTDKETTEPWHLELQHIFPSSAPEHYQTQIRSCIEKVTTILSLNNCSIHLEGKLTRSGFKIIEINGRTGGDYITTHLIPKSLGIDHLANVLKAVIGESVAEVYRAPDFFCGIRFVNASSIGVFQGFRGIEKAVIDVPGVDALYADIPIGTTVSLPPESYTTQRLAAVIARDSTSKAVNAKLKACVDLLQPIIE